MTARTSTYMMYKIRFIQFLLPAEMFTFKITNLSSVLSTDNEISSPHVQFNVTSVNLPTSPAGGWLHLVTPLPITEQSPVSD